MRYGRQIRCLLLVTVFTAGIMSGMLLTRNSELVQAARMEADSLKENSMKENSMKEDSMKEDSMKENSMKED